MGKTIISTILLSRSASKIQEKIDEQRKPINEHIEKLTNPNQDGGRDPQNRNKWRKDIEKALNTMRKYAEKLKNKEKREQQLKKIEEIRQDVNKIPIYIDQPQTNNESEKGNQN